MMESGATGGLYALWRHPARLVARGQAVDMQSIIWPSTLICDEDAASLMMCGYCTQTLLQKIKLPFRLEGVMHRAEHDVVDLAWCRHEAKVCLERSPCR